MSYLIFKGYDEKDKYMIAPVHAGHTGPASLSAAWEPFMFRVLGAHMAGTRDLHRGVSNV